MQHFRQLYSKDLRRIAIAFFTQAAGAGLSALFSIVLARLIGVAGIGLYFIAITVVEIGATFARLGLEHVVLRFVSIAHSQGDRGTIAAIYRKSLGMSFCMAIALGLPVWLVGSHLSLGGDRAGELQAVFPMLIFAIAPAAALALQAEFFKGVGEPGTSNVVQTVVPSLGLLLGVAILWDLDRVTFHRVILLYVGVLTIAALSAFAKFNRSLPGILRERGHFDIRILISTGLPLLLFAGMNLMMSWTDILILGIWSNPGEVGIYAVSMRVASLSMFALASVNSIVAPQFAALYASGDNAALERLVRKSGRWMLLAVSPGTLFLLMFPQTVLNLFGANFEQAAWPLRILTLGQLINVATGSVGYLLIMTGHQTLLRNNTTVWAFVNLVGNLILVPNYGAMGAAISTGGCLALMNIVSWWIVRKKLKINTLRYLNSVPLQKV